MVTRAFVDSNVLANWMLIEGAVREEGKQVEKIIRDKAGKKYPSYVLLEKIRTSEGQLPLEFGTSRFAVAETTRVILDEYIKRRIEDQGIPIQYWEPLLKSEKLSDADRDQLGKQLLHYLTVFNQIRKMILHWYEEYDFMQVLRLITDTRLSTTDAILVGEAIHKPCTYFVTEDRPLRDLLRKDNKIQGISSQFMLSILKRTLMPR